MMATFSITEWKEHQHYGEKRDPTWVKLYQKTLTSVTWIKADALTRGIMLASLLLAARHKNNVPIDSDILIPALAPSASKWPDVLKSLRYLESHGFIEIDASPEHASDRGASPEEEEEEESKNKIPPSSPKGEYPEKFDQLWKAYPSRGKAANPKHPAFVKWEKAVKDGADPDAMIASAKRYATDMGEKVATEFVVQTTRWLNEKRYLDAPTVVEMPKSDPERTLWTARCNGFVRSGFWNKDQWGPPPNESGCKAPDDIVQSTSACNVIPENLQRAPRNNVMAG